MYQELQKADAGAFIPSSVASGQALDMSIERPKWISRADVKANLDKIFVFGDNDRRTGLGGQAKSMRGEPNTIGGRTKKAPNNSPNAFYKDEEFGTNKQKIDEDFQKVLHAVEKGRTVVIPADGLGTGRARLGPRTSAYINEWISKIETTASLFSEDMNIDATVEETVERAQDSVFGNYVDNFQQWASTLKDNPLKAGKMLHALPSSTDPSLTVFREIMMRGAQHFTALNRVLNTVPGARISLWESVFNKNPSAETLAKRELRNRINKALLLQTPLNEVPTDIRPHVKRLREYLEGLYGWYTDSMGMPLKHREHYFPLMFDTAFLEIRVTKMVA
jgi:hypothetical protein